mmetsp:Transcript_56926/g.77634  ORF Transcript_56926/g.77634 Transcript_56926/m.77634 type:complete len:88 (+) Transcript_56926:497-760(+)
MPELGGTTDRREWRFNNGRRGPSSGVYHCMQGSGLRRGLSGMNRELAAGCTWRFHVIDVYPSEARAVGREALVNTPEVAAISINNGD